MIQTMNNKENTLSMALKYIDKHSLLLPENTKTTMNAMFGGHRDASASTVFTVIAIANATTLQTSNCRHHRSSQASRCALHCNHCRLRCRHHLAAETLPPSLRLSLSPTPPRLRQTTAANLRCRCRCAASAATILPPLSPPPRCPQRRHIVAGPLARRRCTNRCLRGCRAAIVVALQLPLPPPRCLSQLYSGAAALTPPPLPR